MSRAHVEMSTRALKDLSSLDPPIRRRAENFIERRFRVIPRPANLDIRPLERKSPWLRARAGQLRIICRRLTSAELVVRGGGATQGYLIVRIVQRRELERAVADL